MQHKKTGVFYILPSYLNDNEYKFKENLVCTLTKIHWRSGKRILIACNNQSQANRIDEALWKFDTNSFLPHNLFKKNIHNTPIVIYWTQCCYYTIERDLLINLMTKYINFFLDFNEIIDFVPTTDTLKQWARVRYKSYKNVGFNLCVTNTSNLVNS